MHKNRTVQTTLGNLIAALMEETSAYVRDETEAYEVVAFMLAHLLTNSPAARSIGYCD